MRPRFILALVFLIIICSAGACNRKVATDTSTAGALVSNAAPGPTTRMLDRRSLVVTGFHNLNDYIRSDVRERLDREPDSDDAGYVVPQGPVEQADEPQAAPEGESEDFANGEDLGTKTQNLEKIKYSWATKKFGDAVAADPNVGGVIVLYADENHYDLGRLMGFVEDGRDRIVAGSGIEGSRMLVVFGGYRGVAQVEMWIVGYGDIMPAFKPDERETAPDAKEY